MIAATAGLYVLFRGDGRGGGAGRAGAACSWLRSSRRRSLRPYSRTSHYRCTRALSSLSAPGVALAAGAAARLLTGTRGLVWAGLALLVVSSAATLAVRLSTAPTEDWRALATAVRRVRGQHETVVVVPPSSRDVFAYYAPYVPVVRYARGEGAWIAVVAPTPAEAITAARPFVRTPRYALLRQFRYGDELRLQHWVRPSSQEQRAHRRLARADRLDLTGQNGHGPAVACGKKVSLSTQRVSPSGRHPSGLGQAGVRSLREIPARALP